MSQNYTRNINDYNLIFIPGGPWISGVYWDKYIDTLGHPYSFRYTLINHEHRYSDSSPSLHDLVLDLENFILSKMENSRPTALVGHSYGAWLMLMLNDELKKLIDTNIFVSLPITLQNSVLINRIQSMNPPKIHDNDSFLKYFSTIISFYFYETNNHRNISSLLGESYMVGNESLIINDLKIDELLTVTKGAFIYGKQDNIVNEASLKIVGAQLINECGHFPMLENPVIFTQLLKESVEK